MKSMQELTMRFIVNSRFKDGAIRRRKLSLKEDSKIFIRLQNGGMKHIIKRYPRLHSGIERLKGC
jgi:hypothetical protein